MAFHAVLDGKKGEVEGEYCQVRKVGPKWNVYTKELVDYIKGEILLYSNYNYSISVNWATNYELDQERKKQDDCRRYANAQRCT